MKLGQRVVCIDNSGQELELTLGDIYKIKGIRECGCGATSIYVGIQPNVSSYVSSYRIRCRDCKAEYWPFIAGLFHNSKRFRLVDEDFGKNIAKEIEATIQKEMKVMRDDLFERRRRFYEWIFNPPKR